MADFMEFSSDRGNAFKLLIDSSGSMENDAPKVKQGLGCLVKSFENFPEVDSIVASIDKFASSYRQGEFRKIKDLDTSYYADGATVLYYAIVNSAKHLKNYINNVALTKGIVPRGTFIVFSDGMPCQDKATRSDAKKAIEELNLAGVTTVFVAFGEAIDSSFGKEMGFVSTIDVVNRDTIVKFLGVELSRSCKEQSRSMKSLGANFFSQAVDKTKSEGYSQTTAQALEDTSWIDDI